MMKQVLSLSFLALMCISANAQILQGSTTVSAANNMTISVTVNTNTNVVNIVATGPSSLYFAYGFGGSNMTNRYSIISEGTGTITERKLGNHNAGSLLTASFTSSTSSIAGSVRTTNIARARVGLNNDYFTFPNQAGSITLIWAKGNTSNLSNHGSGNRGSALITLIDTCAMAIDTTVTSVSNGLMANHTGTNASFQWIDCSTNMPVFGATSATLSAPASSTYRVVIEDGGCVDSSACIHVTLFDIDEFALDGVRVFPNPASTKVSIDVLNGAPYQVSIRSSLGQVLLSEGSNQPETLLQIENLASGIYFIEVVQGNKAFRQKMIKH